MLKLYSQFILQQGIRSPLYLMNPVVVRTDEVSLPRHTNLHYLEVSSDKLFPERGSYYFNEIPSNKKVPISHLKELSVTEETINLKNKKLAIDIRKWNKANLKTFKEVELVETPNKDANTISVVNYNPVKDLYNYKSSPLAEYHKHRNLSYTFWDSVKAHVESNKEGVQLVTMEVPTVVPGFMTLKRIIGFKEIKLTRVVSDKTLLWILDLFQWLTEAERPNSTMSAITDEDSTKILIEFKYKGYATYLPLSTLRSVAEESELDSTVKVSNDRLHKLFVVLLRKIQDTVTSNLDSQTEVEKVVEEETEELEDERDTTTEEEPEKEDKEVVLKAEDGDLEEGEPQDTSKLLDTNSFIRKTSKLDKELNVNIDSLYDVDLGDLNGLIDKEIDSDSFVDSIYEEKINQVDQKVELPKVNTPSLDKDDMEKPIPIDDIDEEHLATLLKDKESTSITEDFISKALSSKTHTAAEIRSLRKLQEQRSTLKSPYSDQSLNEYTSERFQDIHLTKDVTKIQTDNILVPDNLYSKKVKSFDEQYVTKLLDKDIVSSVTNLEKSNIIIKGYEKEETVSSVDRYETHKVSLKPLDGKESTIYFRIPKVDKEGSFMVAGTKYRMRKLRTDAPIRKISPTRVSLRSNYGKLFVFRTERRTNNPNSYLIIKIREDYLGENKVVTKIVPGIKTLNKVENLPNVYHALSSSFDSIVTRKLTFLLREEDVDNHVDKETAKKLKASTKFKFCGHTSGKDIVVVGFDDVFYNYSKNLEPIGTIEDILDLDPDKTPKPFSVVKIIGKDIPLGIALGYYLGMSGLIAATKTDWKVLGPRERYSPEKNELVLRFRDHKLVLTTDTVEKQLIFNGFLFYKDSTKLYDLESFNSREVYLNVVEQRKIGLFHLKELTNLYDMFLDPITKDDLTDMGEPTDYIPLLLRANQLLEDYTHPDINDPKYSRIRGYDRIPGLMYSALTESVREHRLKGGGKIALDPYKVWNYITQDSSVKSRDELNPIITLKEDEAVTLSGKDGLSSGAIPSGLRRYHPNDAGLISEGTVDSKDVAVTTYLSPYAKIKGVRGSVDMESKELEENPGKIFSSAVNMAPFSEYDD